MKPILYLHIGMHKTGTTSIQTALFENREFLRAHDIGYFSFNQNHSHSVYPLFADLAEGHYFNAGPNRSSPGFAQQRNAKVERALKDELASAGTSRFVISGEELFRLEVPGLARLKAMLAPLVNGFRVIVYVREPYAFVASALQQRLKTGRKIERLMASPVLPRYSRIQNYIDVFGRDNVDIRIYDRKRVANAELIADFLSALGADTALAAKIATTERNRSLSHEAVRLLAAVNARYPGDRLNPNPGRARDLNQLMLRIDGQSFEAPPEVMEAAKERIEAECEWLDKTLGRTVFDPRPPVRHAPAVWSDAGVNSTALLINDLAIRGEPTSANLFRMVRALATREMRRWKFLRR